jgi:hypothetical protein
MILLSGTDLGFAEVCDLEAVLRRGMFGASEPHWD